MSGNDAAARALQKIISEIRAEVPPEPEWEEAECVLLDNFDEFERLARRTHRRLPQGPQSGFASAMMFAAAAAAVVLALAGAGSGPTASVAPPAPRVAVDVASVALVEGGRDMRSLSAGDAVEASLEPVTFVLPGVVRWTLSPGGRAVLRSLGDTRSSAGQVVVLERGSLLAEVTPAAPSNGVVEVFAVESAGTRVAAHGTVFRVTRRGDDVVVDLDRGSVAIGPTGHVGPTTGRLLVAPARAAFSLDGGKSARWLPPEPGAPLVAAGEPAAAAEPSLRAAEPEPSLAALGSSAVVPSKPLDGTQRKLDAAVPVASAAEPAGSTQPVAPPGALGIGGVKAHLASCFTHTYGSLHAGTSVVSTLTLEVRDDGSVRAARFDPPLRADFQECAWVGRLDGQHGTVRIPVAFGP